jgi:hypothetical protein
VVIVVRRRRYRLNQRSMATARRAYGTSRHLLDAVLAPTGAETIQGPTLCLADLESFVLLLHVDETFTGREGVTSLQVKAGGRCRASTPAGSGIRAAIYRTQ